MENIIARLRAEYQHKKDKRGWLKANKDIKIYWMCGVAVNMSPCHGEDRGFDSRHIRHGPITQLGECFPCKEKVESSSLFRSTKCVILGLPCNSAKAVETLPKQPLLWNYRLKRTRVDTGR